MQKFENDYDMLPKFKTVKIFDYVFSAFIISFSYFIL